MKDLLRFISPALLDLTLSNSIRSVKFINNTVWKH